MFGEVFVYLTNMTLTFDDSKYSNIFFSIEPNVLKA